MEQYADNTFDGGYGLETVCHAVDPIFVYKELLRVLKPGACFIQSEWVLTEKYIPGNPAHEKIKHEIVVSYLCTQCLNSSLCFIVFVDFIAWWWSSYYTHSRIFFVQS